MRLSSLFFAVITASTAVAASPAKTEIDTTSTAVSTKVTMTATGSAPTDKELTQLSEAFGHLIGKNLDNPVVHFNLERVIKGLRDNADGKTSPITGNRFQEIVDHLEGQTLAKLADENLRAAEDFLSQNVQNSAVIEKVSGKLQYEVLKSGDGPAVAEHSAPLIHYKAMCLDGTVIGDSTMSQSPITVPLDQTVPGFQKAVAGMKVGEKRKIYIHPEMGYGANSALSPNSLLMFEVEVLGTTPPLPSSEATASMHDVIDMNGDVIR